MNEFCIHPEYTRRGEHDAHWVDDGVRLMETPQSMVGSVIDQWPKDLTFELVCDGKDCDVYMNPSGLCFTQRAVAVLSPICTGFAEWLPFRLTSGESLYIFHPTSSVPLGPSARFRSHTPGSNIIEIFEYDFASPESLPCCFLIPQPDTSPAGKAGYGFTGVYVTDKLHTAMGRFRGIDFAQVFPAKETRG